MKLTPYDDFPIHQSPYPLSHIPVTDMAWDEGYYFAAYSAESGVSLLAGMRITPNNDVIGGYVCLTDNGVQNAVRLSRIWRDEFDTRIGPYRYRFIEPFKDIQISLDENESGITFDVHFYGDGPAWLVSHQVAERRGRRVTDQSRYNQACRTQGWIEVRGKRYEVDGWYGARDHTWGLYEPRPPMTKPPAQFLPPPEPVTTSMAMRCSVFYSAGEYSGTFHFHEDHQGRQLHINDTFMQPFEGGVDRGWSDRLRFVSCRHDMTFTPNTRSTDAGVFYLNDENDREWRMDYEVTSPPSVIVYVGYHQGTWKDGGTMATYHGNPYIEWDVIDFSKQPAEHTLYGETEPRKFGGVVHIARIKITPPDGNVHHGEANIEVFIKGRHDRYGFGPQSEDRPHGLIGRSIL